MTTPTFNKFKSTTIYGNFNNVDYPDNSIVASAYFQRNLTISGDLTCSGIINGKKLYYNNVDISSTFVSNTSLNTRLNSYTLSSTLTNYALLSGATFFGALNALTPLTNDVSTKVATTAFVNNVLTATLTGYANVSGGATFTGPLRAITQISTDNTTLVATTAYVKNQGYLTSSSLSNYVLTSSLSNYVTNTSLSSSLSNYALSSSLSNYALSSSLSNYALSSSLSNYALLSGATFTNSVTVTNKLNLKQPSSSLSTVLAFETDTDATRATIYASALSNVFCFDITPTYCANGFEWRKAGDTIMQLDTSGNLNINGNLTALNYSSSPNLTPYALLSGASFSGNLRALTQTQTDNSTLVATTAYVKSQEYITSTSLPSLTPYALLSGASFTGNLRATTQTFTDNTTLVATTAYVKSQNYITSTSLTPYALTSSVSSSYASTMADVDVNIQCSQINFPTTTTTKRGIGFFWNQSGGNGETNLIGYGNGSPGGINFWANGLTLVPTKLVEFLPSLATFLTDVTMGVLKSTGLKDSTNSSGLNGQVPTANGSGGWMWSTAANTASTFVSTRVPGTITLQTSASNSYTSTVGSTSTTTIFTNTINGVSTVNIDWATSSTYPGSVLPVTAPLQIGNLQAAGSTFPNICPIASLNGPAPSNNLCISFPINVYSGAGSSGAKLNGYGAVVKDINNVYWVVFASYANSFTTPISFDPFQFSYQ